MRNGGGPSGVFPGTGQNPCEFVGQQGRFETHSELTELTSGGMLSPPRYDVMTLQTGVTMTWGVGFPQMKRFRMTRRVQLRGIFVVVGNV